MIDDLVSRGHRLHDLVNVYPLRLVIHLHQASVLNRKVEMVTLANAVSVGVSNSLDVALGQGKGKVLERFAHLMLDTELVINKRRPALSERAAAFLGGLPSRKVSHG